MKRSNLLAALAGAFVATVVAGGVAWAAIPGPGGVIQGCYDSGGNVKVVEALPCPRNYTPFQWNAQGVQGLQGVPGENGKDGADGVSPTVTQLAAGNANCPDGGAAITDAAGSVAYVCKGQAGENGADGEPFSGTFTSPNGEYSINVTDAGVTVSHGSNVFIALLGDDISIRGRDVELRGDRDATVKAGVNGVFDAGIATVRGAVGTSITTGGIATVRGGFVRVEGGGACLPAARAGDPVVAPGGAGQIVAGAPTVCVG